MMWCGHVTCNIVTKWVSKFDIILHFQVFGIQTKNNFSVIVVFSCQNFILATSNE